MSFLNKVFLFTDVMKTIQDGSEESRQFYALSRFTVETDLRTISISVRTFQRCTVAEEQARIGHLHNHYIHLIG